MKVQLLNSEHIDPEKWDRFIGSSLEGAVYHEYETLNTLCRRWKAFVVVDGDWRAVFPFELKRKWVINYSFPPMFTQYLGPVFARDLGDQDKRAIHEVFAKRFKEMGRSLVASFSPEIEDTGIWMRTGFRVSDRTTYWLKLDKTCADLEKKYSENIRRNIKKAARRFEVKQGDLRPSDAVTLFREEVGHQIDSITEDQYVGYIRWVEHLQKKQRARIYSARAEDGVCAGFIVVLNSGANRIYSMGALRSSERKSGLSPLLLSRAICDSVEDGVSYFDFEGSMVEGIARFFRSFGSEKITYQSVSLKKFPFK